MMKRSDLIEISAYLGAAAVSVGAAFLLTMKFLTPTHAQVSGQRTLPSAPPPAAQSQAPVLPDPADGSSDQETLKELAGFLEPFLYDASKRRDPFMPFSDYVPSSNVPRMGMTPAQQFDLDQLKLVGIMWNVKDPKAMFALPNNGDVVVLGRDEGIGIHNGYIASIREGEVVVVETFRRRGDVVYKTRVLRLQR